MKLLKKIDKNLERWVMFLLLAGMTLVLGIQIFCRFVLNNSLTWSEELARFMFIWSTFLLPASHNLLISQVVYNGLSDTDKELIMAVGKAAIQYSREQCDARLSERMDLVAQTGTEIVELPADVLEQLRDKCSGVYDEVRATYGDELVDMQISTAEKYA